MTARKPPEQRVGRRRYPGEDGYERRPKRRTREEPLDVEGYRERRDEIVAEMRASRSKFTNPAADLVIAFEGPSRVRAEAFRLRRRYMAERARIMNEAPTGGRSAREPLDPAIDLTPSRTF
jgi:hypothetical protein